MQPVWILFYESNITVDIDNISWLIENGGEISIGKIGPIQCGAVACDEDSQLAALVKRDNENLFDLLQRLDKAIVQAWDDEVFIDEINE